MEWYVALSLIFGMIILAMATGMPIAFAFMCVVIVGVFQLFGGNTVQ